MEVNIELDVYQMMKKNFQTNKNRKNNYLCIDTNVKNNMATIDLIINNVQKVTISVPNFTFKK